MGCCKVQFHTTRNTFYTQPSNKGQYFRKRFSSLKNRSNEDLEPHAFCLTKIKWLDFDPQDLEDQDK
jgi:hypothetical protein